MAAVNEKNKSSAKAKIRAIEKIAARDVGRNIDALTAATSGQLYGAANHIARTKRPVIGIVTGFFIATAQKPAAETDGPVGAAHLAGALNRAGIPVQIITDTFCQKPVKAAMAAVDPDVAVIVSAADKKGVEEIASQLSIGENSVTHLIAVERPGPSRDGRLRNMGATDISRYCAPFESLFGIDGASRPYATIGIGDGGNEIGMGKLPFEVIATNIKDGRRIACRVACDFCLVCGVANWGAVALAAAIACLMPNRQKAMLTGLNAEMDRRILENVVRNGEGVDGLTGKKAMSVDGIGWQVHGELVERIQAGVEHE